jgi:transcription termination/antitermination protein NusG
LVANPGRKVDDVMIPLPDRTSDRSKGGEARPLFPPQWHAVWTRSHCERLVADGLHERGFDVFLPEVRIWRRRAGGRAVVPRPLFPGYLFVRHAMDKDSFVRVLGVRGVVRLLGERWDRLAVIPDGEIDGVQRVLGASLEPQPHPYLREGQRVKVKKGPLAGVEGFLVAASHDTGLLVLSIDLFCRSVAVEVDCTLAVPA